MNKEDLLITANKLISLPSSDSLNIEKAERLLIKYLENNNDDEIIYKYAILQLIPPLVDFENAINILNNQWDNKNDIKAIIYIIIIQDIHSYIDDKYVNIIKNYVTSDKIILSMIYYCLGLYYNSEKEKEIAKLYFVKAVKNNINFTNSYYQLGQSYQDTDKDLSKKHYSDALKTILEVEDEAIYNEFYDWLSIENFEKETIFGNLVTGEKYSYLKSLTV